VASNAVTTDFEETTFIVADNNQIGAQCPYRIAFSRYSQRKRRYSSSIGPAGRLQVHLPALTDKAYQASLW